MGAKMLTWPLYCLYEVYDDLIEGLYWKRRRGTQKERSQSVLVRYGRKGCLQSRKLEKTGTPRCFHNPMFCQWDCLHKSIRWSFGGCSQGLSELFSPPLLQSGWPHSIGA